VFKTNVVKIFQKIHFKRFYLDTQLFFTFIGIGVGLSFR
jgi:hypothetical protein